MPCSSLRNLLTQGANTSGAVFRWPSYPSLTCYRSESLNPDVGSRRRVRELTGGRGGWLDVVGACGHTRLWKIPANGLPQMARMLSHLPSLDPTIRRAAGLAQQHPQRWGATLPVSHLFYRRWL